MAEQKGQTCTEGMQMVGEESASRKGGFGVLHWEIICYKTQQIGLKEHQSKLCRTFLKKLSEIL